MKLYITRHGETEWNILKKKQGWQNSNLTQEGIENSIRLGERLKSVDFKQIYSSPLGRALDTANYIKGKKDIEIIKHDGLKEMGFGLWEGLDNDKILELYTEEHYNHWNKPHLYKSNEGENFNQLFKRVNNTLEDIIKNAIGENVLIVSHGITIKVIYAIIQGTKLEEFWNMPYIEGTALSILEIKNSRMDLILDGDTSHFK